MAEIENDHAVRDVDVTVADASPDDESPEGRRGGVGWLRIGVVAVVALAVGSGATYAAMPAYTETDDYAAAQAQIADREAQLSEWESELSVFENDVAALDRRTAELDRRQTDLDVRAGALDTREAGLDTRSSELDDREAAISTAEAEYEAGTIPGDGIFLIGTDIQPGQYRGNAGDGSCYWARLSGTSGDFDDLIANDNADGPTVVTISESDVAFETNRCGAWHLLE